jgi:hypothetical protein
MHCFSIVLKTFTRLASRELDDVCHMTVWRMLRKSFIPFWPYIFQLLQDLKPSDQPCWGDFFTDTLFPPRRQFVFGQNC